MTISICVEVWLELWDDSLPPAAEHETGMSEFGSNSPAPQVPIVVAASLLLSLQRVHMCGGIDAWRWATGDGKQEGRHGTGYGRREMGDGRWDIVAGI